MGKFSSAFSTQTLFRRLTPCIQFIGNSSGWVSVVGRLQQPSRPPRLKAPVFQDPEWQYRPSAKNSAQQLCRSCGSHHFRKWWPFLRPPLRNQTLISRHPWSPRLASIQPSKVDGAEIWWNCRLVLFVRLQPQTRKKTPKVQVALFLWDISSLLRWHSHDDAICLVYRVSPPAASEDGVFEKLDSECCSCSVGKLKSNRHSMY